MGDTLASATDRFVNEVDRMHAQQKARVEALRDGTPLGLLKASYLADVYHRRNLVTSLKLLTELPESFHEETRQKIGQVDEQLEALEAKLDAAGVRVKKVRE